MLRRLNLLRALYWLTIALYVPLIYTMLKLLLPTFPLQHMAGPESILFVTLVVLGYFPLFFCLYMHFVLRKNYPDIGLSRGQSSTIVVGFCVLLLSTAVLGLISGAFIQSTFPIKASRWRRSNLLELAMGFNFCLLTPMCLICAIFSLRIRNFIQNNSKERLLHAFD